MKRIRRLHKNDYYNGYLHLLASGFTLEPDTISLKQFEDYVDNLNHSDTFCGSNINQHIFVIDELSSVSRGGSITDTIINSTLVASATVNIHNVLIHNMNKVAHIEDVVVDSTMRGRGLGKEIIDYCVKYSRGQGCYKCILNCSLDNVKFYEKCGIEYGGFQKNGTHMSIYFDH